MNRRGNHQNFRHGGSWSQQPPPQPPERGRFFPQQWRPPVRTNGGGLERIDRAVAKARRYMIAAGEHVSAWKVSRVALLTLEVDSWETLGVQMNHVPSLYSLIGTEGKINAFIHCFMAVRKITSLYDLELAICENEGIEKFEELELGPFLKHPLVIHHFSLSPDVTEVFQIKSEDIISYLHKFVDNCKGKVVKNDELLDFIASKRSVASKEMQQVRIRSLGLHIAHIKCIQRSEETKLKNFTKKKSFKKRSGELSKKFLGDHMRYVGSSEEEDNNVNECENNLDSNTNIVDEVNRGPFPLEAKEERHPGEPSRRKGKLESTSIFSSPGVSRKVRTFITTWKERCMQNDPNEVLEMMLDSSFRIKQKGRRKTVRSFFATNNNLALLHLAVISISRGMWDSMLDTSNTSHQNEVADKASESSIVDSTNVKVEPVAKDVSPLQKTNLKQEEWITVEDVMRKVTTHFDLEADFLGHINQPREKLRLFLRILYKCESLLVEQFAVKDFEALGHGEFFMFLDKYIDLLPDALLKCLISDPTEKGSLGVYLLPLQLNVLLSQASNNMWQTETVSTKNISELLTRQFPLVCFEINESEFVIRENEGDISSGCVLFSATLFGIHHIGDSSTQIEKNLSDTKRHEINSYGEASMNKAGILGIMTTKDAVEILCKAPMLADLELWSHWDLVFAPSLGPLLPWLLNEVHTKELRCLVTKGGRIIRLDHSATVGSFLEVLRRGLSFETAVQLSSLFSLYGGEKNVPVSLLKWHARKAFEVLFNSSMEMELEDEDHLLVHENDMVPKASRFVLDCLGYLPIEFCSFAADILLSGLETVVKNAPTVILSECQKIEQRILLHEVGASLNVAEWISDYHLFNSSTASNESISSPSSCLKDSNILKCCSSPSSKMTISKQIRTAADGARVGEVGPVAKVFMDNLSVLDSMLSVYEIDINSDPAKIIETIRLEEFGLDSSLSANETTMLKKQHARLGRALNCLSHELYSQDSHFLLELVQNADDNVYQGNVEPTLVFILQEKGIIVLNNERGFSAENIRALCDVGNSTKKKNASGYIRNKGIGFKSVFRVTDTPEIHSGGFHIKYDITEGQIGFILPSIVLPRNTNSYARLVAEDA